MSAHSVLHEILHRLQTIELTLVAIEGRMLRMSQATQDLANAVTGLIAAVNSAVADIADLTTKITAANDVGNDQAIEDAVAQIKAATDRLQSATQPVQAAATAAGASSSAAVDQPAAGSTSA